MTIVLRRVDAARWADLGAAGVCRVGLCVIVASLSSRAFRVVWLDPLKE